MTTIRNLTNSPYNITLADGSKAMLPARGSLEGVTVSEVELALLKACGYIRIEEDTAVEQSDAATEYENLSGEKPDGRWSESRIMKEIDKLQEADQ